MSTPLERPLHPLAWIPLLTLASVRVLIYVAAGTPGDFGFFRDELYYLACADHLSWGYVDQPPLSIVVLALVRLLLGDSLFAIRLLPALASGAWLVMVGLLARELGGSRTAQFLAAALAFASPNVWGMHGYYSMNVFDSLFWLGAYLLVSRLLRTEDQRMWLWLGVLLGFALLNKIGLLWFGAGLLVALLLSRHRRWLLGWQPYAGAAIALALFLPHIIWQFANDWPTLDFMRNAMLHKFVERSLGDLLGAMFIEMHPLTLPFWVGGLAALFFYRRLRPWRPLAWIFLTVLSILGLSGSAKPQYLMPAMPVLLAAGAVVTVELLRNRMRWLPLTASVASIVSALPLVPLAIPVLDEESFVAYAQRLGVAPSTDERKEIGSLPQHFADRHGWEDLARTISKAYQTLTAEERTVSTVLVENYGEAAALDYYRDRYPLPSVLCGHNSYYLWGPPEETPRVWIVLGFEGDDLADEFESVEKLGEVDNPWSMPYERHRWVRIARKPFRTIQEIWPELRNFS